MNIGNMAGYLGMAASVALGATTFMPNNMVPGAVDPTVRLGTAVGLFSVSAAAAAIKFE